MMLVLLPLHEMINAGATTPNEQLFITSFGKDLEKAWNCCKEYAKTHNDACLQLAWDLYAHVFRILQRQLQINEFEKLHLSHFSPELEKVSNLELVIPGTYIETYLDKKPLVRIQSFAPMLKVIPSKQRPRKLVIHGSDGKDYPFLLKGSYFSYPLLTKIFRKRRSSPRRSRDAALRACERFISGRRDHGTQTLVYPTLQCDAVVQRFWFNQMDSSFRYFPRVDQIIPKCS